MAAMADTVLVHPNRDKAEAKATKAIVILLLLVSAGLILVVTIGAWVRLTDAGLGCPDWPGCYGQLVVPDLSESGAAEAAFPDRPLETGKAWREMIHRYLASTLGLVCLGLAGLAWRNHAESGQPTRLTYVLVGVVVFQGEADRVHQIVTGSTGDVCAVLAQAFADRKTLVHAVFFQRWYVIGRRRSRRA